MQISHQTQPDNLLRNTLYANAAFSFVSALAFLFATQSVATMMGIGYPWLLTVLGAGFIPFILTILWVANGKPIDSRMAWAIIAMDVSWIALSYLYLLFAWSDLTVAGRWFVFLQAEVVSLFALFQYLGVKRL